MKLVNPSFLMVLFMFFIIISIYPVTSFFKADQFLMTVKYNIDEIKTLYKS